MAHNHNEQSKKASSDGKGGEHHDHSNHHKMMIKDFKKRFWVSLIITIPILVLSPMIQNTFGYEINIFGGLSKYILFTLSTIIFFYGGKPFLTGLYDELKKKLPGMMTLIAVAISVAWAYSSATTFGLEGSSFFWELATLIDIMLLGHWIEMKSVLSASKSLQKLVELMPSEAHLVKGGNNVVDVKVDELKENDEVIVKPGEKIPVDGKIIKGESYIDESMVTGESKQVKKSEDSKVIGGTINGNGSLTLKVEQVGENAYLSKVINMVKEAQNEKSKSQNLADRIAFWLTIVALTVGFSTLIAWIALGETFVFALERMATVMVITCPHALGLAIPLVVSISTSISAKNGLLIRNRTAFENSRKISVLAFDKTGTLTKGNFAVLRYNSVSDKYSDDEVLQIAGSIEGSSEHPIAIGIIEKMKEKEMNAKEVKDFNAETGKGVEGKIDDNHIRVVSPRYIEDNDIKLPKEAMGEGKETVVYILENENLIGYIALADEIRKESFEAVKTLKENGIKVYMITGDNENIAKSVSDELELDGYFAQTMPDKKLEKIREMQEKGEFVAMTGDGINDAPALAAADIGIAVGSGTDVAAETADIILVNSNPKDISSLVMFGKATYNKMIQNFIWATAYNVVAIPLATGMFLGIGLVISPALGAVLMSLSTVIVAINAQLLKYKLRK